MMAFSTRRNHVLWLSCYYCYCLSCYFEFGITLRLARSPSSPYFTSSSFYFILFHLTSFFLSKERGVGVFPFSSNFPESPTSPSVLPSLVYATLYVWSCKELLLQVS
ncbi:uncharacterized protein BO66DRAFT_230565 [Aspergillus aculeatinus CBS 121060]|uniref:Uncharacterized protein n=1 Tax=Aspergillus aculeatinus CBS 121060 TaxID=1448322 RepID=A0ACD1GTM8_9EURO|nr:hypothetical protein BO66DRAFT_230565 [Aspergillus aculeatinus CBS 121060]RAH64798.1 hypothetical protein BO66DRAFT_230565 [Aspergillus aculeatinus CBS 121060]